MLQRMTVLGPLFVGEVEVEFDRPIVRLTGLMQEAIEAESLPVAEIVMSEATFRRLLASGRKKLARSLN